MNIKKIIFTFSSVAMITLTSCGSSGFRHTTSKFLKAYSADLDHDGEIGPGEKDLTWSGAYDKLIADANSMAKLNEFADNLNISKEEPRRTSLARYEILHEAEELAMSTGSILPLYNYGDPYILKPNMKGIYTLNLGYKFLDKLCYNDGNTNQDFTVSLGTKAETFDPASNSDSSTANVMVQFLIGAKRYVQGKQVEGDREGIYEAKLVDGVCDVKKRLVYSDYESHKNDDDDDWILFDECPDLVDEMNETASTEEEKKKIRESYEGTARYTITMKEGAVWNDGTPILAEDFIYEWNRASSGVYNGQAFGMWCSMFDMIRGYNVWNLIGQQTSGNPEEWDEDTQAAWNNTNPEEGLVLTDAEKYQYMQVFNGYTASGITMDPLGCAGGMAGVMKGYLNENKQWVDDNTGFTVQLINDCDYFEDLLAFLSFMPVAKRNIIIPSDATPEYERTHICEERPDWWLNKKTGDYLTNGPLEINGPIDNVDSGKITLKKASNFTPMPVGSGIPPIVDDTTVDSLTCLFIDKESAAYDSYKSNVLQLTDRFPSSIIDQLMKMPDWHTALKLGLFYYGFNVNDNTFDIKNEGRSDEEKKQGERNRENLRNALVYLINKDDIANNVAKQGSTAANGYISDGVMEHCIPVRADVSDTVKSPLNLSWAYVAATDDSGEVIAKNWHERNKDMSKYWDEGTYAEHYMDNREPGGFYETVKEDGTDEYTVMKHNTDKAIELAKKAGVNYNEKTGKFTNFPRLSFSTNNGTGLEDIAERMQAYLDLWGIDVSINTQEWNSFLAARRIGDFAIAREGWIADFSDPRTYLDLCVSTNGNNDSQLGKDNWHASH